MAGFIQGKNCILKVNVLGDYLPLICAKSFTLTVNADTVETTTQGTGPWKTFDYDALNYTISFDGAGKAIDSNPIVFDMMDAQTGFVEVGFQALYIDNDNVIQKIQGVFIVTQTALNAIAGDALGFGIEFQGTGEFSRIRLNNPKDLRIIVTGTANGYGKFRLIDDTNAVRFDSGPLNNATDLTFQIDSGNYYYEIEADSDANDNDADVNTPAPIHHDFNADLFTASSYPTTSYDFTASRTVTFTLGIATTINWSFDKIGTPTSPQFKIIRGGVELVVRSADSSGTLTVSGGDEIQVTLTPGIVNSNSLNITNVTTSTVIYNNTTPLAIDETFAVVSGQTYSITASISVV